MLGSNLTDIEIFDLDGKSSTHGVDLPCRPRSTPTNSDRNLSEVGRCRSAGCPRHGCRGQAPRDGFTASPHSDTAPPSHGMPLSLLLSLLLLLLLRLLLSLWPLRVQGAALPN